MDLERITCGLARCAWQCRSLLLPIETNAKRDMGDVVAGLNLLGRSLAEVESPFMEQAGRFRAMYDTEPRPVAGVCGSSWHEIAYRVADEICGDVLLAADPQAWAAREYPWERPEVKRELPSLNWGGLEALAKRFPRVELERLAARVEDEGARAVERLRREWEKAGRPKGGTAGNGNPAGGKRDKGEGGKSKRGRKPTYDPAADVELLKAWKRAQEAGVSREEFCEGRDIAVANLEQAQGRLRKRRNLSE